MTRWRTSVFFVESPNVPVPANDGCATDEVILLVLIGGPSEVEGEDGQRFLRGITGSLGNEIAQIVTVVPHGGIFPIDYAGISIVNEDIGAVKVVVAENWFR